MKLAIALIAAVAENGVIGCDNALPWRLPADLKHFRALTIGKPVIMGRKTWESLGRPLPGRVNIVVTRQQGYAPEGAQVVDSLASAFKLAAELTMALRLSSGNAVCPGRGLSSQGEAVIDECVVIGGAEIYAQAIAHCDRLYLTEVHATFAGDTFFPPFDREGWREVRRERHPAAATDSCDYSFVVLERRPAVIAEPASRHPANN